MAFEDNISNFKQLKAKRKKGDINTKDDENILCKHCKRSASNGIRCLGICVEESGY